MNTEDITKLQVLLDRYYAGETDSEENHELFALLDSPTLPEEFMPDRETALLMTSLLAPDDLEKNITERINTLARKENEECQRRRSWKKLWRNVSTAAAVAIVACIGIGVLTPAQEETPEMTPEEAYAHTQMALDTFADALNKYHCQTAKAESAALPATQKAFKSLETIGIHIETN